ncbi:MAG: ABC transporter permease subunit [Acidaminococcaceae bacterium]
MPAWLLTFPELTTIDFASYIDHGVHYLNLHYAAFFDLIKTILLGFITTIHQVLNLLPWWLLILLVVFAGKRFVGSYRNGLLYGLLLFCIGIFGYWSLMNETLAIVIAAVLISLIIGLPVGILLSTGSDKYFRPVLDAMQTMPTFVYMIPAVMLLGPGKVPAVLATVVYAVVPVIRLTGHGIRQVDHEVIEAARAFGSSRWQILWKVQIPQALPTIMTGVNQTMMMAVAMVVTCSMIGANGLGMEVLIAINRTESGRGLIAGISIVIIAIIIDRLTQGLSDRGGDHA